MKTTQELTEDRWDIVIEPKSRLLKLNLGEVWRYRDLLLSFVRRDFVAQFKQTILGPVWHLIQPILTTAMFLLIFSRIARISTDGIEPKVLFYMSGIIIWNYFAACLTNTANTFVANAGIFGKVYFPRLVLPLSVVLSNIIRFGIQFLLLLATMIFYAFKGYPIYLSFYWLLIPVLLLMMAGIGLGLGIIISSLTTKYRDFAVLLTFAVQLGMYATPIAYPLSYLEGKSYKMLISLNPITPLVETFRYSLFGKGTFDLNSLGYSFAFMLVVLVTGTLIFNKVEKNFMDTV
ncbi:ABC transporter permease [Pseudobacter ginsenosidimutans]|uniref:Transport permease protein n=1 Tax=Pseudobacter ginsenosidimutans TaxID=661488 RepID=A0A4Q7MU73_9BACT|nr:ABC transporter permease [Pseudobacter ginsenosidimutans]QEC41051.1 ABC transporter permease [Pseudobacter ginsenosidimutans]RZS72197.1 lipopolysaccharide transport system permease protein [Pseudobacter ginsenosidimutans]